MEGLSVTPYYAAALGALFVVLSLRVISVRRSKRIGFGTNGDPAFERRIRAHANFAEYAPFGLLLLVIAELRGTDATVLHGLCVCLLGGRLVHAVFLAGARTDGFARIVGMSGTFVAIIGASAAILISQPA